MNAREAVLGRVRSALRRSGAPEAIPPVRLGQTEPEDRIASFCLALEKLAGKTYLAQSEGEAESYVRHVVGDALCVSTCDIAFPAAPVELAQFGVTSADYALADTGTLVVLASSQARLPSLLPPTHIAILRRERILSGLDELLAVVPSPAALTSSMVLITGPSRTADIEQILVRGVHGPGELHAVIV
jgi:L-lactate dehydrogenase complex protein LldG